MERAALREFLADIDWTMPEREIAASPLPCLRHLDRVAACVGADEKNLLASFLAANRESFRWGQTYTEADFGRHFIDNYGWLELFGMRGPFANDRIAGGFLLLGPDVLYPDHRHIAEEIYIPLTGGAEWRMGNGPFAEKAVGAIIHHRSNVSHSMRTGAEPLLALYLWRGGPLDQRSIIGEGG